MKYKNENKICQNCKKDFTIESEDFNFYEKIKVPPPTFCPECRMVRRMIWRNHRSLHKRSCGLCQKPLISGYSGEDRVPVYCTECWNGTGWDPFSFAKKYDFSMTFFEQLKELFQTTPRFYAWKLGNLINSEFTNFSANNKNAYLSFSVIYCEDVLYSEMIDYSRNSLDCYVVDKVEGCSYNIDCEGNYNSHYALQSRNCIDSSFIFDCANCSNCCLSSNLRNQQYVFKNKKLSPEEYKKSLEELKLSTYSGMLSAKKLFNSMVLNKGIHKYALIYNSPNSTGNYIYDVRNAKRCFDTKDSENVAYTNRVLLGKDCMDISGLLNGELIYESMAATENTYKDFFCYITLDGCNNCEYSLILNNCSYCFACVGLRNASYCIFNKQYSKKEYEKLVSEIKKHMFEKPYIDKQGRVYKYGEFFPYDMCPFGYNESMAQDYFPVAEIEALEKGFTWRKKNDRDYKITIKSEDLPNATEDIEDSILDQIISCPNNGDQKYRCTTAFKIVSAELQFYKQKNLPLPRFCPNCRHYERLLYRNPMRLWGRKCMCDRKNHFHGTSNCKVEFETTYAPDRPEIVYCEKCYQQEIY